jgi:hypothetical protein
LYLNLFYLYIVFVIVVGVGVAIVDNFGFRKQLNNQLKDTRLIIAMVPSRPTTIRNPAL